MTREQLEKLRELMVKADICASDTELKLRIRTIIDKVRERENKLAGLPNKLDKNRISDYSWNDHIYIDSNIVTYADRGHAIVIINKSNAIASISRYDMRVQNHSLNREYTYLPSKAKHFKAKRNTGGTTNYSHQGWKDINNQHASSIKSRLR